MRVEELRWRDVAGPRSGLPAGLDHGCAVKTWATAPPLKGGRAHGLDGEQLLARTEDDRVDDETELVDQPGLDERSSETGRRPARAGIRLSAPASDARRLRSGLRSRSSSSPQSADVSDFENATLEISFIGAANGPDAPGQKLAQRA
jgi:hypothetical protein